MTATEQWTRILLKAFHKATKMVSEENRNGLTLKEFENKLLDESEEELLLYLENKEENQ